MKTFLISLLVAACICGCASRSHVAPSTAEPSPASWTAHPRQPIATSTANSTLGGATDKEFIALPVPGPSIVAQSYELRVKALAGLYLFREFNQPTCKSSAVIATELEGSPTPLGWVEHWTVNHCGTPRRYKVEAQLKDGVMNINVSDGAMNVNLAPATEATTPSP